MESKQMILVTMLLIGSGLIAGCTAEPGAAAGAMSVSELLESPVYDTEVEVYGEVSLLGELFCPCFELTSGEAKVQVWYDLMVEDDGTPRPAVRVEGIQNGDQMVVTGELKTEGTHRSRNDFWATSIDKAE